MDANNNDIIASLWDKIEIVKEQHENHFENRVETTELVQKSF
jgi:hypothetical protein